MEFDRGQAAAGGVDEADRTPEGMQGADAAAARALDHLAVAVAGADRGPLTAGTGFISRRRALRRLPLADCRPIFGFTRNPSWRERGDGLHNHVTPGKRDSSMSEFLLVRRRRPRSLKAQVTADRAPRRPPRRVGWWTAFSPGVPKAEGTWPEPQPLLRPP